MLKGLQKHSPLLFSLQRPRRCQRGERRRGRRGALLTHQREKEAVPKGVLLARAEERGGERTERRRKRRRRSLQVQSTGWQKPRSSAQHGGGGEREGERREGKRVSRYSPFGGRWKCHHLLLLLRCCCWKKKRDIEFLRKMSHYHL